jgi:hypothetical protein
VLSEPIYIVYDGECPFCSRYVRMLRLRKNFSNVVLLNARNPHPVVDRLRSLNIDLDQGMALVIGKRISHGAECVHQLALMSTPSGLFNWLTSWVFSSRTACKVLYPPMRAGRNAVLRLLGRSKLTDSNHH